MNAIETKCAYKLKVQKAQLQYLSHCILLNYAHLKLKKYKG